MTQVFSAPLPPSCRNEIMLTNPKIPNVGKQNFVLKLLFTPVREQCAPDMKPWKPKSWIENNVRVLSTLGSTAGEELPSL
jgi:hypothetical protein